MDDPSEYVIERAAQALFEAEGPRDKCWDVAALNFASSNRRKRGLSVLSDAEKKKWRDRAYVDLSTDPSRRWM